MAAATAGEETGRQGLVVRRSSARAPWTRAEAEAVLADAAASGLTLFEYARRHKLSDATLYGWRLRLQRRAARSEGAQKKRRSKRRSGARRAQAPTPTADRTASVATFVPVVAAEATRVDATRGPALGPETDTGIELVVGRVTVRVGRQFCAATLGRLLPVVLEALSC